MRIRTGLAILAIALVALTPGRVLAEASGLPPAASAPLLAWPENFSRSVQGPACRASTAGRCSCGTSRPGSTRLDAAGRSAHPHRLG